MRYLFTPTRMAIIKSSDNTKYWLGWGEIGTLIDCWWECKMVQLLWKTVWRSLKRLNIELPYDPASPFLGVYPREMKTYVHTKTCTQMFIAVQTKKQKQQKYPSTDERTNKMWGTHTMEYYSAIQRNEVLIHAITHTSTWKCYAKWKKSVTKAYILYESIYIKCPE